MSDPFQGRRQELLERVVARGKAIKRQRRFKFTAIAAGSAAVVVLIGAVVFAQRDPGSQEVAPIASGELEATPSPTPEETTPTATSAPAAAAPTPAPTPTPICVPSDFATSLVPDAKSHHQEGTFHFVATARNVSDHDCPARTGMMFWVEGPKPGNQRVFGWGFHGDFFDRPPPPWRPGEVERLEFDWQTKNQHPEGEPVEPGDYVVTIQFDQYCPDPDEPRTGPCAAFASTTVTVEPTSSPSPSTSPPPLT